MPPMSAKNYMLTGSAAQDLGLGDMLKQELEDQADERKKKLLQTQKAGFMQMGPAAQSLFSNSPGGSVVG